MLSVTNPLPSLHLLSYPITAILTGILVSMAVIGHPGEYGCFSYILGTLLPQDLCTRYSRRREYIPSTFTSTLGSFLNFLQFFAQMLAF